MEVGPFIPLFVACVPIVLLWMNQKAAAKEAKAAREAAVAAADVAYQTSAKVDAVSEQLDGRITMFMDEMRKRAAEQYAVGSAAGRTAALSGPIAASIAGVEKHLTEQDASAAERHDETNGKTKG